MSGVFPTIEQIEDYMESLEELLFSSLQAATPDLPRVSEAIHRLWEDVSLIYPGLAKRSIVCGRMSRASGLSLFLHFPISISPG